MEGAVVKALKEFYKLPVQNNMQPGQAMPSEEEGLSKSCSVVKFGIIITSNESVLPKKPIV